MTIITLHYQITSTAGRYRLAVFFIYSAAARVKRAFLEKESQIIRKALLINELRVLTGKSREKNFVGFHIIFISNFIVIIQRTRKKAPKMHGSVISFFRL